MFRKISKLEFEELTQVLNESRRVEFKPPFDWKSKENGDINQKERFVRALISMSNTPQGGRVIIGYQEKGRELIEAPLTKEQWMSFVLIEEVEMFVDSFVTEKISFSVREYSSNEDRYFLIFEVEEFEELPNLCKKDSQSKNQLIKGFLYARTIKAPYSSIPAGEREFREIVRLAMKKQNQIAEGIVSRKEKRDDKKVFEKIIDESQI
ncbi:ATP-binding protein [Candidatus Micrarchaeota archaeon]|jgi:hypothetical protein|nr:ATP-binding protein [Candidatus Micrarchaeota archaeon]